MDINNYYFGLVFLLFILGLRLLWDRWEDDGDNRLKVFHVCPNCGCKEISAFNHTQHYLKEYGPSMGIYTCPDCSYTGPPVIFNSEDEYDQNMKILNEKSKKY